MSSLWKGLPEHKKFYNSHHGLHVFDNVLVPGCKECEVRAAIHAMARMKGLDPEKAEQDPLFVRKFDTQVRQVKKRIGLGG